MQPFIDAHVHIQPWKMVKAHAIKLLQTKRPDMAELMYDPKKLLGFLDEEGVEKIWTINYVSPDIMGFTEEVNDFAADMARECAGRIVPFGSLNFKKLGDPARSMKKLIKLGIRGIKLHPPHQLTQPNAYRSGDKKLAKVYRIMEQEGMPLMVHTGTSIFPGARNVYADPMPVDDVAIDFPKLKIILAHGGRPIWMSTAIFLVRRHPNVFMDISSIPPQGVLSYFPKLEQLADKVLFGSDFPAPMVPGIRANAEAFLNLALSEAAKRAMVYDNAKKFFGD